MKRPLFLGAILLFILAGGCQANISVKTQIPAPPTQTAAVAAAATVTTHPVPTPTILGTEIPQAAIDPFIEQVKTVNGLEIRMSNLRRSANLLQVDMCFPMPDNEDWTLNQLTLHYNGIELHDWSGSLIEPILPAADGKLGRRCDTVYFSVANDVTLTDFTISVDSIHAMPREGGTCQRASIVQPKLAELGIQVTCQEGADFSGYRVIAKPASMSQEDAQRRLFDAMNLTIHGPWEFKVHLHSSLD